MFWYLDQNSLQAVGNCFQSDVIPEIRMMQCRKQEGVKDCGIYAIVFSVALAQLPKFYSIFLAAKILSKNQ